MNTGVPHAEKVSETERVRLAPHVAPRRKFKCPSICRARTLGSGKVRSQGYGAGATAATPRRSERHAVSDVSE